MSGRRLISVASASLLVLLAASCGVPTDAHPHTISSDDLPAALRGTPSTTSTTAAAPGVKVDVVVYLVNQDRLAPVSRTLPTPVTLADRLETLLAGATPQDTQAGLRSAVAPETRLVGIDLVAGVADVNLSQAFVDLAGQEQIVAVAEIVFTATETPGVHGVRFRLDGERVPVPTGDGTLTDAPLTRDDYALLRPI